MNEERVLSFPNARAAAEYTHHLESLKLNAAAPKRVSVFSRLGVKPKPQDDLRGRGQGALQNCPSSAYIGDSIMVRFCKFVGIAPDPSLCRGGLGAAGLLKELKKGKELPPKVTIMIGTNDVEKISADVFDCTMTEILECLDGKDVRILTILPRRPLNKVVEFNKILVSKQGPNVTVIGAYDKFISDNGKVRKFLFQREFTKSGVIFIHPSLAGLKVLKKLLK